MQKLPEIRLSYDARAEDVLIENYVKVHAAHSVPLQILEAGCGQQWPLNLDGIEYVLTGVDLDQNALEIRKNVKGDLHKIVVGDLCTVNLPDNSYDVIYSSFVLEHIQEADVVLKNFAKWMKQRGLLVVRVPDPYSVRGFVTRITPHWFHIFYYRYVQGNKKAGTPGYGPYTTFYNPVISRRGIYEFCRKYNFTVKVEYGDGYLWYGDGLAGRAIKVILRAITVLSFGKLTDRHANLLYILERDGSGS